MENAKEELEEKVTIEERMIIEIKVIRGKHRLETPSYYGSLNLEELRD